jgi:predicted DNA-binding transcriptional regulator AlpA
MHPQGRDAMLQSPRQLLRWLLRELSTDDEDMIALVRAAGESDDDDAQALVEELASSLRITGRGPLRVVYRDGRQLIGPADAARMLDLTRVTFYELVKRGSFPKPISINDSWLGWPRGLILEWADESARARAASSDDEGYAPFERCLTDS